MPFFGMAFEGHNLPFFGKIRDKPSKRFKLFWSYGKGLYGRPSPQTRPFRKNSC